MSGRDAMPSLTRMIADGAALVRRYRGLVLTLYAIQLAVAALAGWSAARILAAAFATRPLFDEAVDGDVVAFLVILREHPQVVHAVVWVALAAVIAYVALSWFLIGGLNATFLARPGTRREVAATFGAGAATSFGAYVRLALVGVMPSLIILGIVLQGLGRARLDQALTLAEVAWAVLPGLAPGAALLWLHWTAVDYARIELAGEPHAAAWRALLRGYRVALTGWRPLVHTGLYAAFFALVSAALVLALHGRDMPGVGGAVLVFAARQVVAMARFGAAVVCAAGQVVYLRADGAAPAEIPAQRPHAPRSSVGGP